MQSVQLLTLPPTVWFCAGKFPAPAPPQRVPQQVHHAANLDAELVTVRLSV